MALTIEEIKQRHTEGRFVFQLSLEQIKELQQEGFVIIATHNGTCHADDVFACTTIKLYQELCGKKVIIVRTKDPEIIAIADSVVDTGKVYDPEKNRFDHHQEGGAGLRDNNVPYASFGLVWKHYGLNLTELYLSGKKYPTDDIEMLIYSSYGVEQHLVESIDAYDCGIEYKNDNQLLAFNFGEFVSFMRPTFFEKEIKTAKRDDSVFEDMCGIAEISLKRFIGQLVSIEVARKRINKAFNNSEILVLDFAIRISEIESIIKPTKERHSNIKIVVIDQNPKKGGVWTVNIPRYSSVKFPKDWLGKSGEEFAKACGFADVSFCHPEGFTLTCSSKGTAIALAQMCK